MQQSLRICFIWADKIAHSSPESHTDPYAIMEWYIPNHSCVWIGRRICASAVTDCRLFCLCPIRSVSLPCDGNFAQRLRWMAGGSRSCATKTERTRRSASLPCDGTRTDKQKGQPTSHRLAFFVLPFGQDAMPSHFGYCISIFFGCNSGRFFIVTVSIPFSILAVRVARSALSGISALMA